MACASEIHGPREFPVCLIVFFYDALKRNRKRGERPEHSAALSAAGGCEQRRMSRSAKSISRRYALQTITRRDSWTRDRESRQGKRDQGRRGSMHGLMRRRFFLCHHATHREWVAKPGIKRRNGANDCIEALRRAGIRCATMCSIQKDAESAAQRDGRRRWANVSRHINGTKSRTPSGNHTIELIRKRCPVLTATVWLEFEKAQGSSHCLNGLPFILSNAFYSDVVPEGAPTRSPGSRRHRVGRCTNYDGRGNFYNIAMG